MVDATNTEAINNEKLWKPWFKNPADWQAWQSFLQAMFGLPMDADARETFERHTARSEPHPGGYQEAWLIVGRRGGKSLMMATMAVYLAVFRDWAPFLVPGETALIQVIATDRTQARVVRGWAKALLLQVPVLQVAGQEGDG